MIYFRLEVLTIYKHFRVNKDVIDDAIDNACPTTTLHFAWTKIVQGFMNLSYDF